MFNIDPPASNHNGGRIGLSPTDGYLCLATGGGGNNCYLSTTKRLLVSTKVAMPKVEMRQRLIANSLLQFFQVRKTSVGLTRPHMVIPHTNLEDAILAWNQCNFANRLAKRPEQFLGHPSSPRQPAASIAINDFNARFVRYQEKPPVECLFIGLWTTDSQLFTINANNCIDSFSIYEILSSTCSRILRETRRRL